MEQEWLAINFTMPKEPSRVRVSVWRKLKRIGSVNIGQSIWVLPPSDEHLNAFQEIAAEVKENYGQAFIMKTHFIQDQSEKLVVDFFNTARDEEYKEFLEKCEEFNKEIEKETAKNKFIYAEIEENEHELRKLSIWLGDITKRDFFGASLKEQSQAALFKCKGIFEGFSNKVYEINS